MTTQPLQSRVGLLQNTDRLTRFEHMEDDIGWELSSLQIIKNYLTKLVEEAARGGKEGRVSLSFRELLHLMDAITASIRNIEKALS